MSSPVAERADGPTILETWVLLELGRADGPMTPTELAARLAVPRPMVIDVLVELAALGLLEDASAEEPAGPDEDEEPALTG